MARQVFTPTPEQVARFGHIAAAIRAEMKKRKLSVADLHEALGLDRKVTTAYAWIQARGAPGPEHAHKLSTLLSIPIGDLAPHGPMTRVRPLPALPAPAPTHAPVRSEPVLTFRVTADGQARLTLDVTLPVATATPLLRMLLDAGLVMGTATQNP